MSRHKDIYDLFTIQNNIKLTKQALSLLSDPELDLKAILLEYKLHSTTDYIDLDLLKSILSNKHSLVPYPYKYTSLIQHYAFLKSKYNNITDISNITNGQVIFGYVYTDKNNVKVIEDGLGVIKVKGVKYNDVFMKLKGSVISGNYFLPDKIDHDVTQVLNIDSPYKNLSLVIFNGNYTEQVSNVSILLNSTQRVPSNVIRVNDDIPRVFTINNIKITIYNKPVLSNIKDIPLYLDNYNYNFMAQPNFFYKEEFDLFVVTSDNMSHIEKYKNKVFVMIKRGNRLEIANNEIKIV